MKPQIIAFQVLIIACFYLSGFNSSYAQSIEVSGWISENTTWSQDTVKVTGSIIVDDSVTLNIEPGVRVEFQGHYIFCIWGTLLAEGTKDSMITFTIHDTTGFSDWDTTQGGWNKIFINNGSGWLGAQGAMNDNDTSRISFCKIEYSKCRDSTGIQGYYAGGAITVIGFSRLVVSNCEISNNRSIEDGAGISCKMGADFVIRNNIIHHNITKGTGGGIYCWNASPIIEANEIIYNESINPVIDMRYGGGINCEDSGAIIKHNNISHNKAYYAAGINLYQSYTLIDHNIISYNNTENGWAAGICCSLANDKITNNTIANNTAREGAGIVIGSSIEFINNLVVNNSAEDQGGGNGGGIIIINSEPILLNNTICNNVSLNEGGGIFMADSKPQLVNNIIWGNTATSDGSQVFLNEWYSMPDIINCVIQGGKGELGGAEYNGYHENIIDKNPEFIDPSHSPGSGDDGIGANWEVEQQSACINGGNQSRLEESIPKWDIAGMPRISHGVIDIGAYEALVPSISISGYISKDTILIADTIKVDGNLIIDDDYTVTITPGAHVEMQGSYKIDVRGTLVAKGLDTLPIIFTVKDTTGFSDPDTSLGGWKGIRFDNGGTGASGGMSDNDTSVLEYCEISFVKTGQTNDFDNYGTILVNYFSNILISNCTIRNNHTFQGGAVYCNKSDLLITGCLITNNHSYSGGSGIFCEGSNPVIRNNRIIDTEEGIQCLSSKVIIDNNIISGNSRPVNGAGIFLYACSGEVMNNIITNNSGFWGGGICCQGRFSGSSELLISNNIIANNTAELGGAIGFFDNVNAMVINNTICYNTTEGIQNHIGTVVIGNCSPVFLNNIIWGNVDQDGLQILIWDLVSFPEFYFNNIQDSIYGIRAVYTDQYRGPFDNNTDTNPHFINPPEGAGSQFDGLSADFSLLPISGCINSGTPDTSGLSLTNKDIIGNPRINDRLVDIGAIENQDGLPAITDQPGNQISCEGDSILLNITTQDTVTYLWKKNGTSIPGAISDFIRFDSITIQDEGSYQCVVNNAYGKVNSNQVYLLVRKAPEILTEPGNEWIKTDKPFTLEAQVEGTSPLFYSWKKDGELMADANAPELILADPGYEDEGTYTCIIENACGKDSTSPAMIYLAPQICIVTVDPATGNNLIVWEKNSIAPVSHFNIYRESKYAGIYDLLESVPNNDISIVLDSTADPTSRAYLYKITAVDTTGYETYIDLCNAHKTIHLLVTSNPETKATQLDWDRYVGFEYGTYVIYRSDTTYGFAETDQMSSSSSTWADPDPGVRTKYYRVAALKPFPCIPTGNISRKADAGPYSHSMSNIEDNRLQATASFTLCPGIDPVTVYPNPFTGSTILRFSNPEMESYTLFITDVTGKISRIVKHITNSEYILEKGNLKGGIYFIELRGQKIFRGKIVIK